MSNKHTEEKTDMNNEPDDLNIRSDTDYEPVKDVLRICYHVISVYSKEFQATEYSFMEAYVLETVGRYPEISASKITEHTDMNKGYISHVVKKLLMDGVLTKRRTPGRNGQLALSLTEKGQKIYREMDNKATESIERHISTASDDDKKDFFRLMKLLDENLKKVYPDSLKVSKTDI